jgi:hypothetical protein
MVVAMVCVRVMQMIAHEIIDMSRMGDGLVTASVAVHMLVSVRCAFVRGRAASRVFARVRDFVLHHLSVVGVMEVAIVKIVHVTVVPDCNVAAGRSMSVLVFTMFVRSCVCHGVVETLLRTMRSAGSTLPRLRQPGIGHET